MNKRKEAKKSGKAVSIVENLAEIWECHEWNQDRSMSDPALFQREEPPTNLSKLPHEIPKFIRVAFQALRNHGKMPGDVSGIAKAMAVQRPLPVQPQIQQHP
jgi:hypothetical protein